MLRRISVLYFSGLSRFKLQVKIHLCELKIFPVKIWPLAGCIFCPVSLKGHWKWTTEPALRANYHWSQQIEALNPNTLLFGRDEYVFSFQYKNIALSMAPKTLPISLGNPEKWPARKGLFAARMAAWCRRDRAYQIGRVKHIILCVCTYTYIYTGWWFGTFFNFPYIGNNHHPNWRTPSFFRGVAQPPTRKKTGLWLPLMNWYYLVVS